jgi:hypothetical protein
VFPEMRVISNVCDYRKFGSYLLVAGAILFYAVVAALGEASPVEAMMDTVIRAYSVCLSAHATVRDLAGSDRAIRDSSGALCMTI